MNSFHETTCYFFNGEEIWPSRLVIWFTSPIFVFSLLIFSVWRIVYIQVGLHPLVWIVRWLVPKHYVFVNIGMLYKDIWFTLYSHHHTHWNRLSLLYVIIIILFHTHRVDNHMDTSHITEKIYTITINLSILT